MPYKLKKKANGKYVISRKGSGKAVAGDKKDLTREQAFKTMKELYANK